MDLRKDQSPRGKAHQTPDPHSEIGHIPEVIGTRCLRNREQLRKRKAEAQEKETFHWLFGEHKRSKRQRMEKGNESGRRRQQATKLKVEPRPRKGKKTVEEVWERTEREPTEQEPEPCGSARDACLPGASEEGAGADEDFSERGQESLVYQENCSESQETGAQNHLSETGLDMAEPEVLSSETCQETVVLEDCPSRMFPDVAEHETCQETPVLQECPRMGQDMAEPEVLSPETCQETAVLEDCPSRMYQDIAEPEMCQEIAEFQEHPPRMDQDMAVPEDLSPKMCKGSAVPAALASTTSEDTDDLEGCPPGLYPEPEVPEDDPLETDQKPAEEWNSELDRGTAEMESVFLKMPDTVVPKDLSTKTDQETTESESFSHKTYEEMTVPKSPSPKTLQETAETQEYSPEIYKETPELEDYSSGTNQEEIEPDESLSEAYREMPRSEENSPEIYQETSEPEDLRTKPYTDRDVPKECIPEAYEETGVPAGQNPTVHIVHQEETQDASTFPQECTPYCKKHDCAGA
ncbi:PREDICTED: hemogen [Elephantulus edwardii]|uniref:hemogen n=1 Tax=Elephantulus edwardii TaxID=28737 RepID=UPI0003F0874C|nr:PREDICTED: hemogen [Elephantulus edwardii]